MARSPGSAVRGMMRNVGSLASSNGGSCRRCTPEVVTNATVASRSGRCSGLQGITSEVTRRSCGREMIRLSHWRSEEHTSELQSHHDLVCRLLLEKKKKKI